MIYSLLFSLVAICPLTEVENKTDTWTMRDMNTLRSAKFGCKRIYGPNHCLAIFIKEAELTYVALCREEIE